MIGMGDWLVRSVPALGLRVGFGLAVVIALGRIGFESTLRAWNETARAPWASKPKFGHASETATADGSLTLIASYHPSRQNTQTGRLTREMFRRPFERARQLIDD
jgi:uracil-DNA glycosylase